MRESFGIAMPNWSELGVVLALGAGISVSIEVTKFFLRRRAAALAAGE